MSRKTPMPYWGNTHLGPLVGTTNVMFGRYLNGLSYPTLQMMQKFEVVFGWPIADQVQYIPYYWFWPEQRVGGIGGLQQDATDLRYGMKLKQILQEWGEANPRTQRVQDIKQHPAIPHRKLRPGDQKLGRKG